MPILPLDHPEPFAATLGVMLYPAEAEAAKARAFAAQWLAVPLQHFDEAGHTLPYDALLRSAMHAGETLSDVDDRIWCGSAAGELFKALFALAGTKPELASWNNAVKIAELVAARTRASGARSAQWNAKSRFVTVAHLWAAWSIRGREFATDPDTAYDGWVDFQSFLAEAEILRDFGQNWRPPRKNSKPPLPADVWRTNEGWKPLAREPNWPKTGMIPLLELPEEFLRELRPAGRPSKPG
jgi:hypothetical protein